MNAYVNHEPLDHTSVYANEMSPGAVNKKANYVIRVETLRQPKLQEGKVMKGI